MIWPPRAAEATLRCQCAAAWDSRKAIRLHFAEQRSVNHFGRPWDGVYTFAPKVVY